MNAGLDADETVGRKSKRLHYSLRRSEIQLLPIYFFKSIQISKKASLKTLKSRRENEPKRFEGSTFFMGRYEWAFAP